MTAKIRPLLVDFTLMISLILLIVNSGIISNKFFNYQYDKSLYARNDMLYIVIYIVYIVGLYPNRYIDLIRIVSNVFNTIVKVASDNKNIIVLSTVFNLILVIISFIIIQFFQLTPNIMIILGVLTSLQIICRLIWGYNMLKKRILSTKTYDEKLVEARNVDTILNNMANADYEKLYEILVNANKTITNINKLKPEDRNKYIIEGLLKVDLSKVVLNDQNLNNIKNKFQIEKDKLQKDIDNLNIKVNKLSELKSNSDNLVKCIKKYS
jgi:hypothetical protein